MVGVNIGANIFRRHRRGGSNPLGLFWGNEAIEMATINTLNVARGAPTTFAASIGGKDVTAMELNGSTDGFLQDASGFSHTRADIPVVAVGDSMTRGAGSPLREIDFGGILGSVLPGNPQIYNLGVGGDTTAQMLTRLQGRSELYSYNFVFWGGHNGSNPTNDVANIQAMIDLIGHNRYVVVGTTTAATVNDALALAFPDHYIDPRPALEERDGANWPNLRIDTIHLTEEGSMVVAQAVTPRCVEWFDLTTSSHAGLQRNSSTYIFALRPQGWSTQGPSTVSDLGEFGGDSFPLGNLSQSLVGLRRGDPGNLDIRTSLSGNTVTWSDGVWTYVVIRFYSCTADIKTTGLAKTANPFIRETVLTNAITELRYGARGAPSFNRQSPEADLIAFHVPRAISYDELVWWFDQGFEVA